MISIHVITKIDLTIKVDIIVFHDIFNHHDDFGTSPGTFTFRFPTVTIGITVSWTVFLSPFIFTFDDTSVDFTFGNVSIIIGIAPF